MGIRFPLGILFILILSMVFSASQKSQNTLVVNTTDDRDDGHCDSIHCSLREAINAANLRSGPNLIVFDPTLFPLSESGTIKPTKELPHIIDFETTIDATGTGVTIDGSNLTSASIEKECFTIHNSSRTVLKGMKIQNFPGWSTIFISSSDGGEANDNTLIDLILLNNGYGLPPYTGRGDAITIGSGWGGSRSCGNKVISCLIERNADDGIAIEARDGGACHSNLIVGNTVKNNAEIGIEIDSEGTGSIAGWNTIADNKILGHQFHSSFSFYSCNGGKTDHNIVCSNSMSSGRFTGIDIYSIGNGSSSSSNLVVNNQIMNQGQGIRLGNEPSGLAVNNIVKGNTFRENEGWGINLSTDGNRLYHNNFIQNTNNGCDGGNNNTWDDKGKGNYWSDYQGLDNNGDGIGDTPYSIFPNGQDRFPLIKETVFKRFEPPKNLRATALPGKRISLNWEYQLKDAYGFVIHRKEKIGKGWEWIPVKWTVGLATKYSDTRLIANSLYVYRVQAYDFRDYSFYSNTAQAKAKE